MRMCWEPVRKLAFAEVHHDTRFLFEAFDLIILTFLLWRLQSVLWSCISAEEVQGDDHL